MLLIEHYVAPSSIHGLGVFAASFVAKGTKVWVFHPAIDRVIPVSELAGLPDHVVERIKTHGEYLHEQDAFLITADGDYYMNHCDDPNIEIRGGESFARRDILEGEELHFNYSQTRKISFDTNMKVPKMKISGQ